MLLDLGNESVRRNDVGETEIPNRVEDGSGEYGQIF
jgi:hypothetical protein